MGSRIVLDSIKSTNFAKDLFANIVLVAPDVDRELMARQLRSPNGLGSPTTLYASLRDQALAASWRAHGYPRAGDLSNSARSHEPEPGLYQDIRLASVVDTTPIRVEFSLGAETSLKAGRDG